MSETIIGTIQSIQNARTDSGMQWFVMKLVEYPGDTFDINFLVGAQSGMGKRHFIFGPLKHRPGRKVKLTSERTSGGYIVNKMELA